jgi:hypothetical protein
MYSAFIQHNRSVFKSWCHSFSNPWPPFSFYGHRHGDRV